MRNRNGQADLCTDIILSPEPLTSLPDYGCGRKYRSGGEPDRNMMCHLSDDVELRHAMDPKNSMIDLNERRKATELELILNLLWPPPSLPPVNIIQSGPVRGNTQRPHAGKLSRCDHVVDAFQIL